ncbi:unnamed protein product [Closterium sp. Yama58-4]|nr:unnamed protein product [Closterium sp. Yama58-4]
MAQTDGGGREAGDAGEAPREGVDAVNPSLNARTSAEPDDPAFRALFATHKEHLTWTDTGRLRCALTGHEFLPTHETLKRHVASRVFAKAGASLALRKFEPHVVQSPDNPNKLLCTLTNKLIQKSEDAVWKHMMGHKFQKQLVMQL